MDFDREWTVFALEAEYDAYGMQRIVEAHNKQFRDYNEFRAIARDVAEINRRDILGDPAHQVSDSWRASRWNIFRDILRRKAGA